MSREGFLQTLEDGLGFVPQVEFNAGVVAAGFTGANLFLIGLRKKYVMKATWRRVVEPILVMLVSRRRLLLAVFFHSRQPQRFERAPEMPSSSGSLEGDTSTAR